ncbi:hypothetical protein HMPREF9622_01985 [Cutibacterium modestum HL037PA3]|uniref:Uncharacterized protein n=1 Tax=Cutibacterium modestum HL044PA1 TaxID=765109 RepID=A0ABP2KDS0_9ACTN|nr:hypothetical protein HMPREF9621_02774 [Cutibacterium modestum HL037PA2]EFS92964.1 hypothetical protein HMPREF9607_00815 [Cutibacterium modestum HL044PA1]EFT15018.1 hypothetical protein HMPREF9622_01985 [Cutibacterium modestum HL037PA3]
MDNQCQGALRNLHRVPDNPAGSSSTVVFEAVAILRTPQGCAMRSGN